MKSEHKYMLGGALGVIALAGVALAGGYVAQNMDSTPTAKTTQTRIVQTGQTQRMAAAQPQPARVECDDNNIVGTLGGGVAGGVLGAQFGSGSGRTIATTAGALGGAALGNKYIPTRGATCD